MTTNPQSVPTNPTDPSPVGANSTGGPSTTEGNWLKPEAPPGGEVYKVKKGECLATIAKDKQFYDWKTIYDDSDNEELKKRRPNPNVLYPGDWIVIPAKEQKAETCAVEEAHRFRVTRAQRE